MEIVNDVSPQSIYFKNIGKEIYSHREYDKIIYTFKKPIFPNPSCSSIMEALTAINNSELLYYILYTSYYTGNSCLILTKFNNILYNVFYYYNDNNIYYSYEIYN